MSRETAIIIGAGPAGLTAAYELLRRTDVRPVVLEMSDMLGGIARTVNYKGNRIEIGGHRFFSKSDRVMQWWTDMMPLSGAGEGLQSGPMATVPSSLRERTGDAEGTGGTKNTDEGSLIRVRNSTIY